MRLSIVLEWDNALLAESGRCRAMLGELARQIERLIDGSGGLAPGLTFAPPVQLVVVYDQDEAGTSLDRSAIRHALGRVPSHVSWPWVPAQATYYDLKNEGVSRATGDLVVLLDSDVLPEPDWLANLLEPFADPSVVVVGGGSHVDPVSVYAKSFALGWLFPLRAEQGELHESRRFYANNVAFRAEVIRRHPFPAVPGACRGAGRLLARDLRRAGIQIHRNPRARVAHPPPRPRHFVRRGIAAGRDNLLRRRVETGSQATPFRASWNDVRSRTRRAWRRIRKRRDRVELKTLEVPPALMIMGAYYGLFLADDLLTRVAPRTTQQHFRI